MRFVVLTAALFASSTAFAAETTYPTPQDALDALAAALGTGDPVNVAKALGPGAEELTGAVADKIEAGALDVLHDAWKQGYRMVTQDDGSVMVELGADGWPFPVPLVKGDGGWAFDIKAGAEEIAAREIGGNELDALDLIAAYGAIQALFRLEDHDADGVMEFASSIISPPGTRSGLYWTGEDSPVGDRAARASLDGFLEAGGEGTGHEPYSGYYFRVLNGQTAAAPGGEMSYMQGDNMVAGHALLAVPAEYGVSAVKTFLVNEAGMVWEADLGESTLDTAYDIQALDPDPAKGWTLVKAQTGD
ncbi:DUF2950 family protein [Tabrizicola sp. BL-A-41-H6]|uniref:DUF2950 family protein n=1 Tax=Tabrizicola sp. BL-A-41-H6 TaxID=3421107 RepID=UPI003D67042C